MLLLMPGWAPGAEVGCYAGVILRPDQHVASFLMAGCKTAGCILTGATLGGIVVCSRSPGCARPLAFLHLQRAVQSSLADASMPGLHSKEDYIVPTLGVQGRQGAFRAPA